MSFFHSLTNMHFTAAAKMWGSFFIVYIQWRPAAAPLRRARPAKPRSASRRARRADGRPRRRDGGRGRRGASRALGRNGRRRDLDYPPAPGRAAAPPDPDSALVIGLASVKYKLYFQYPSIHRWRTLLLPTSAKAMKGSKIQSLICRSPRRGAKLAGKQKVHNPLTCGHYAKLAIKDWQ